MSSVCWLSNCNDNNRNYHHISEKCLKIDKIDLYFVPFKLIGCKLPSGVALADVSDAIEFTDDNDDNTSDTGATPSDESISSKSLFWREVLKKINKFTHSI